MKTVLTSGYAFTAANKTLDFTGTSGFDVRRLLAVLNVTRGVLVYAVGTAGLGYSALAGGNVLTLAFDTTAHANGDALMVLYEAPSSPAQDSSLQSMLTQLVSLVAAAQSTDPTLVKELPVQGIIDMPAAGTTYAAGRAVEVVCTTGGAITLTYADGSTRTRTLFASQTPWIFTGAVTAWALPNGSSFVGSVCNLK